MKVKFIPKPIDMNSPFANPPKLANGWVYNKNKKAMFEYRDGLEVNKHLCSNEYAHDVYECTDKYNFPMKNGL